MLEEINLILYLMPTSFLGKNFLLRGGGGGSYASTTLENILKSEVIKNENKTITRASFVAFMQV